MAVAASESIDFTRKDIENYMKMKFITEMTLVREKLGLFEKKYHCDFSQFEDEIKSAQKENFERWDDYMEWKAFHKKYNKLKERVLLV